MTFPLVGGAHAYKIEMQSTNDLAVLNAIVPSGVRHYDVPTLVWVGATGGTIRWRVTALNGVGEYLRRSGLRRVVAGAKSVDVSASAVEH